MRQLMSIIPALLAALALGCATPAAPAPELAVAAPVPSQDPRVKFKDGERYLRDLSAALSIPRAEICKELSQYDCVDRAFRIALGGVEAPNMGIHQPLEEAALTAPIALDRVALHVCINRVERDVKDPQNAIIFRPMAEGQTPVAWRASVTETLYDAILRRAPSPAESGRMIAYFDEVAAGGTGADAGKDWATLSCFALASSLENIFY
jgi:hypothetical protein